MRFEIDLGDVETFLTAYLDDYNTDTCETSYEIRFLGVKITTVTGNFEDEVEAIRASDAPAKAEVLIKRLWNETP